MENKESIAPFIALITVGVMILIMFVLVFIVTYYRKLAWQQVLIKEKESSHQQELLSASLEIAEQERAKIAANVHDEIGIMLHVFKQNISRIRRNPGDAALVNSLLDSTDQSIDKTITITRGIANQLMPSALGNIGFIESIGFLCDHFNALGVISIAIHSECAHIDLDKSTAIHLYRLINEVMNNIVKHTDATTAEVFVHTGTKVLYVTISHNGKGISNEVVNRLAESSKGIGLKSIMGRAQLIKASVQYVIVHKNLSKIIVETPISC